MTEEKITFELEPQCLKKETTEKFINEMQVAIDNRGHLIPCCYCDTPNNNKDENYQKLLKVSKISDYDSIEEIYLNKEWTEFVENLKNNKGFYACHIVCKKRQNNKNVTRKERIYYKGKLTHAKDV